MTEAEERAAFEARDEFKDDELLLQRNESGEYHYTRIQGQWVGWMARAALSASAVPADVLAKEMFVARLEAMERDGHTWLTVHAVLALLNDCDLLASGVAAPQPQDPTCPKI